MQPPCQLAPPPFPWVPATGIPGWHRLSLVRPLAASKFTDPDCSTHHLPPPSLHLPSLSLAPPRSASSRREFASASCLADRDFYYLLLTNCEHLLIRVALFLTRRCCILLHATPATRDRPVVSCFRSASSRPDSIDNYTIILGYIPQSYHRPLVAH